MTTRKKNPLWAFFSSVKLALFLLFILAATSIVGTVIQQNQPAAQYVKEYGEKTAHLFQLLDLTDMYNSWWFLSLLGIFSLNLIVCSLERIPNVIRIVRKDNLTIKPERLAKMRIRETLTLPLPAEQSVQRVADYLRSKGWKTTKRHKDDGTLLFSQRGAWTRFGVYIVHLSILVILVGAVIGSPTFARKVLHNEKFAFKGSIMIPESQETNFIYSFTNGEKIDLGFTIHCSYFTIDYYSNGMPKTYLSKVTILENGKPVTLKDGSTVHDLKVNKPLTYKGITFYQSSYQPYSDFLTVLVNTKTHEKQTRIIAGGKQITSKMQPISFGIINQEVRGEAVKRVKIWFSDNQADPAIFWLNNGQKAIIKRPSSEYELTVKQLYATGLQVTKDPGVWFVYIGCGMMLFGLFVAFFMSHRKIYAFVREEGEQSMLIFAGSAHKNKVGFEKVFAKLVDEFQKQTT